MLAIYGVSVGTDAMEKGCDSAPRAHYNRRAVLGLEVLVAVVLLLGVAGFVA